MGRESADDDELAWVSGVLGGHVDGPSQSYLCRPGLDRPELLVPLRPRAVAAGSMRRFHDDRSAKQRLVVMAGQLLGRTGALDRAPGDRLDVTPFALVESLARALGEPELIAAVSLGPRRRNRKPVLQLLRPDGRTIGFAKVGWSPLTTELITNEARWLRHVDGRMPDSTAAPAVLVDRIFGSNHVAVTAPVDTPAFSRRRGPLGADTLAALARLGTNERATVGDSAMVAQFADSAVSAAVAVDRLVERHGAQVVEFGMWHGDLTPWNTATSHGVSSIWDWEFADDHRPVGFDALHIAFELVRRRAAGNERAAVDSISATPQTSWAPWRRGPPSMRSSISTSANSSPASSDWPAKGGNPPTSVPSTPN